MPARPLQAAAPAAGASGAGGARRRCYPSFITTSSFLPLTPPDATPKLPDGIAGADSQERLRRDADIQNSQARRDTPPARCLWLLVRKRDRAPLLGQLEIRT